MNYIALSLLTVLLVPGPTNSLLLQIGVSRGFNARSMRFVAAEWLAYVIQMTLWGVFIDLLMTEHSWVVIATKIFAVCFLFYISLKLWFSVKDNTPGATTGIAVPDLFVATLTNPKGLFFVSFVAPAGTFLSLNSWVSFMLLFSLIIFPVGLVWIAAGAFCGRKLHAIVSGRLLSRAISLVIGLFACGMLFNIAAQAGFA
ncbi:UNVERIFIED_ORG: threonine/homoserine/homoserine lactone efflux protein [Pseudomonas lini]|uniref:LysE family transporter n=1 Tax=Pseudomonas viciae TaxID=2505979 RepID=A0A4P7PIL9_9PSED|nr:LysE family transporter [Pseudomonas viciae]QBZ90192.1 threonine transporter RhtB [Pseudomonas viciae]UZE84245.1 LysE family transporter [Pseudomonas viciae]WGO91157.1 LysE family transporter [Pseudomonas viciae]